MSGLPRPRCVSAARSQALRGPAAQTITSNRAFDGGGGSVLKNPKPMLRAETLRTSQSLSGHQRGRRIALCSAGLASFQTVAERSFLGPLHGSLPMRLLRTWPNAPMCGGRGRRVTITAGRTGVFCRWAFLRRPRLIPNCRPGCGRSPVRFESGDAHNCLFLSVTADSGPDREPVLRTGRGGQSHGERRPAARFAGQVDRAAMGLDNRLHQAQTQTQSALGTTLIAAV